ncbi:DUF3298 and DUF4163 domain-containing protein [Paenibacillus sp. N1-5-1-14]|uniref:DUF3298 and DUF4163 domain-containing protein n=1 Tax=Paenibacillus radicibacter TaxID=2972488 RepID=UPI0021592E29|nr:DUF3298 and DUF4163 domain-containing protein [Paenibacillus radicibacter]MCR8642689.1 DUF3298 and DUF4163 domain-containing protein [Paenibacillus radicibacter]
MPTFEPPVMTHTHVIRARNTTVYYPVVTELSNTAAQKQINQRILQAVHNLMQEQTIKQDSNDIQEMLGEYEIKSNERGLLSLTLSNYTFMTKHAHGLTLLQSLTFNIHNGHSYTLQELFKPGSNYVTVLSELVAEQIKERQIPLLTPWKGIRPDQDYYIADKALVIYFQQYEITPSYFGTPMFPISVYSLSSILDENGPLGIMSAE